MTAERETELSRKRDPVVGQDLGSLTYEVSDQAVEHYFEGLELDGALCRADSPFGEPIAPTMLVTSPDNAFIGRGSYINNHGHLWMRQEWDLLSPLLVGETYEAAGRIVDIYRKRDRNVVKFAIDVRSASGELMASSVHHQSYLAEQSEGEVKLREPKAKEGARLYDPPRGEELESVDRTISLEMCGTFFLGAASYHTDQAAAESLGFREVVVGGRMTISYIGELMERRFGRGWWSGGKLDTKFVNVVTPGDHVTARAVLTDRKADGDATRAHVSAWIEKDDGTVVLVASASALEG